MKIDHFYIKVDDLDKAIKFYEDLLETKITHREGNRWVDFKKDKEVYFGIFNAKNDGEIPKYGDNTTLSLKTKDLEKSFEKIKKLNPKTQSKIITIKQPALYKYFQFEDLWGNVWEVAEYDY